MKSLTREQDARELRERLGALREDDRPVFGSMPAAVAVCHVREAYRVAREGRELTPGMKLPLPPPVIKWLALKAPMRWRPGIKTALELEPGQPGTVPTEFEADRAGTLAELERFAAAAADGTHPYFGTMTRADWLRWGYLHADHHLRQFGR